MWPKCQILNHFSRFSKKCWYSRPPLWPSLTSYSFKLPATLPSSSTSSCIEAKSSLFLNKNNEIFHKHEFVPQVSPEYQTLHLHRTFAQDSAALSGTTKFRVTAPFWVVTNIFPLCEVYSDTADTLSKCKLHSRWCKHLFRNIWWYEACKRSSIDLNLSWQDRNSRWCKHLFRNI